MIEKEENVYANRIEENLPRKGLILCIVNSNRFPLYIRAHIEYSIHLGNKMNVNNCFGMNKNAKIVVSNKYPVKIIRQLVGK